MHTTAPTVHARPDTVAGLVTAIAAIPDVGVRRGTAARAAQDRRNDLGLYLALVAENGNGYRLEQARRRVRRDALLVELETLATA